MNIANWLYQSALSWPERPAVFEGERVLQTYRELLQAVCDRAAELSSRFGIEPGDRVAIFAKNAPEYIDILHACWCIGAIAVPVNAKLHPKEAEWIIDNAGARLVYTDDGRQFAGNDSIREIRVADPVEGRAPVTAPAMRDRDDVAWLFYTSGTTGRPKGVMITHGNLVSMSQCYAIDVDSPRAEDHMLYAAPMSHGAGLYMLPQIRVAGRHVVPASRGFDCDEIISLAKTCGNLVFFAAPTMVKRLITASRQAGFRGEGIRTIIYGGGPMYANDIDEALELYGPRFAQIYGQGETPMTISALPRDLVADESHPRWRDRRSSVGIAQACVSIRILGPDGEVLRPNETGEICVKSPTVMKGYWRNEQATAEAIRDGWLRTGDLGHLDEDGFLYLTDRSKDVIISGGTNIYPREVEEVLLRHPAVFEVAVVGEPETEWGEQVVAFVVIKPGQTVGPDALEAWCRQEIASFKKPKRYIFIDELPKNSYGKVVKTELRKRLSA